MDKSASDDGEGREGANGPPTEVVDAQDCTAGGPRESDSQPQPEGAAEIVIDIVHQMIDAFGKNRNLGNFDFFASIFH